MLKRLPVEILCRIIDHLPVASILHLRQVSKHLNQITYERSIWDHVYRTSSLVHREGPFSWQTAQILESNLVESAKLSLNWPPKQNVEPTQSRVKDLVDTTYQGFQLLCGRWLLSRKNSTQIYCCDLDRAGELMTEESCSIFYECHERDFEVTSYVCEDTFLSTTSGDENHPVAFFSVTEYNAVISALRRTLYRISIAQGSVPTLRMVIQTNHTATYSLETILLIGPRFLTMIFHRGGVSTSREIVLVDIVTSQQYRFPESALDTPKNFSPTIITSSSHVLLIQNYDPRGYESSEGSETNWRIQAYLIPPLQKVSPFVSTSLTRTLELSHEVITKMDLDPGRSLLLRDSNLHQPGGAIHITLVSVGLRIPESDCFLIKLVFIKLNPTVQGVGSITLETKVNELPNRVVYRLSDLMIQPSLHGCTRGIAAYCHNATTSLVGLVIDDEDTANSQVAAGYIQCLRDFKEEAWDIFIEGFDAYRGRIVTIQASYVNHQPIELIVDDFL
ncbi:hypothetical protein BJ138DRAFT_1126916 [Hygrophoropsis aurantiaca]|uniref:Uncharacterized protein n=1 Tax=Hygrophoropsis aurantiaca TaxID=72124 RepID=A0ACB8AA85_9AGAM|nr:hypothetical protein BJ138DRAFT_1126916 [Hygrophoropsis aurantiaca]